jgi:hypothetical protein
MQQCVHRLRQNPHLGFNAKVERLQQGQTTRQSPSLKGMLLLKRKPHGGVIAIGNALGNAVVAGLSDKPKAKTPAEEKKLSATEQADLDLKMAEMDAALHNRMEGKAEDGATFTSNGTEKLNLASQNLKN